ncbi:hypothetical protein GDO86_012203 [Hymenochirus boettgeri]|uniref:Uncharacterized protein n=1 Tax=Hymenochirus boettgeri TaxID=247094 RepID=A0A8T2IRT4_9PIPI|nr:hypothetical protein GDO86_012203 [Hymenochirus boettgeri]
MVQFFLEGGGYRLRFAELRSHVSSLVAPYNKTMIVRFANKLQLKLFVKFFFLLSYIITLFTFVCQYSQVFFFLSLFAKKETKPSQNTSNYFLCLFPR